MNNYKLIVQYDGTDYCGWQIQNNAVTVQQAITSAIETILKEKISLIGSGRTDAGVHALGQTANFRTENGLDERRFLYSLNSILPHSIAVKNIEKVNKDFHSRFDANKRSYLYLITKQKSPFYYRFSYKARKTYDIEYLNYLSKALICERDFTSFSRKNTEIENKNCIIYNAHWKETRGFVIFHIEANRFLHGMVRTFVGSLMKAEAGRMPAEYLNEILELKDREKAGEAVPAKGLFLYKVKYPADKLRVS